MFNSKRYITKGVEAEIPLYLQTMMWHFIDTMAVDQKDYLQVFEFTVTTKNGYSMQTMRHTQEQPPYEKQLTFADEKPISAKVFVIDDQTHTTMLLASEY